jgi:hypothetical protein
VSFCWILPPLLRSVETDDLDIETSDKEKRTGLQATILQSIIHSIAGL